MNFRTMPVLITIAGFVILYGAVANRNPLDVIKLTLSGGDISDAAPIFIPSGDPNNLTAGPGAVPGGSIPGTPEADGDARTDPPGFDPKRDDVLPILPGEGSGGTGVISYQTRTPFTNSQYWV